MFFKSQDKPMADTVEMVKDGELIKAPTGFSWTVFFFGILVPLFRKDYKWFGVGLVLWYILVGIYGVLSIPTFFWLFLFRFIFACWYNALWRYSLDDGYIKVPESLEGEGMSPSEKEEKIEEMRKEYMSRQGKRILEECNIDIDMDR